MSLIDYCYTDHQRKILELYEAGNNSEQIGRQIGVDPASARRAIRKAKARGAQKGDSQEYELSRPIPDGYKLKGFSDMRTNEEGKPIWYKVDQDAERQAELYQAFIEGICSEVPPVQPTTENRTDYHTDIMPAIFIGDAHVGMQAFARETKHSDFNVDIACKQLREAFDYHVERMEPCENALLVDVGDFTHANDSAKRTLNGTPLDTDATPYSVLEAAGAVMMYGVERMLTKCKRLTVVVAKGNHNTDPAIAIAQILRARFYNEPRVNVLPNESFYQYIEWNAWLLGFHHGHKQKPEALAASMARDMAKAWGRTTHRMWCTGHFHQETVKPLPGVKHKVFAALPPPDSWHAAQGYLGDGEMEMITFRASGGIHSSHVFNIPQPSIEPDVRL